MSVSWKTNSSKYLCPEMNCKPFCLQNGIHLVKGGSGEPAEEREGGRKDQLMEGREERRKFGTKGTLSLCYMPRSVLGGPYSLPCEVSQQRSDVWRSWRSEVHWLAQDHTIRMQLNWNLNSYSMTPKFTCFYQLFCTPERRKCCWKLLWRRLPEFLFNFFERLGVWKWPQTENS